MFKERWIDAHAVGWTIAIVVALLVGYYLWRTVRMYYLEKRTAERAKFYAAYEPPKGQDAIDNRRQIEAQIELDPDFADLNRRQRRALAVKVDFTMRQRAKAAKA